MPANLPPQYYELERQFRNERDTREKLRLAEELLTMMPKHKGTDKLQADMKTKISKLRQQLEQGSKSHGARQTVTHDHIEKEGAGQVILIGPPNSGKSSLVDVLTSAKPEVADYPFTTREPLTGMMPFETIQIQLIDTPPIAPDLYETYLSGLIRNADTVVLVADLAAATMIDDLKFIIGLLDEKHIVLKPHADEKPEDPRYAYKRTIICGHKMYEVVGQNLQKLGELFPGFVIVPTSIIDDDMMNAFKRALFDSLGIIRVYTKPVGHDPDYKDPIILPIGATVELAATTLHKDFAKNLKFARIWGAGKFDGQRVQNDFQLSDTDVLEFHM